MDFITPTSGTIFDHGLDSKRLCRNKKKNQLSAFRQLFLAVGPVETWTLLGFYGIKTNPTELIKKLAFDSRKKVKISQLVINKNLV